MRKIRCIFRPRNSNICNECFSRGVQCVNQADTESIVVKEKRNVRERLTVLENMLASVQQELNEHKKLLQTGNCSSLKDNHFGERSSATDSSIFHFDVPSPSLHQVGSASKTAEEAKARQILLSILPTGQELHVLLRSNDLIFLGIQHWKRITKPRFATLDQFARYALREGTCHDLAGVAHVLASVSKGCLFHKLLQFVHQFVISNDELMHSVDGLQCAALQGVFYSNSGEMARAWQTWRRALSFAQVLGLHKTRKSSEEDMAWWALYSLDRFFSLNLGLPPAIADEHCNLIYQGQYIDKVATTEGFALRLSRITGNVINHLEGCPNSSVHDLSNELTRFAADMPPDFWVSGPYQPTADWQMRIMCHLMFYRIEFALHLPYLLAPTNFRPAPERDRCIEASRKFLRTYIIFRHSSNKFAEICRVYDSVACAATMVLLLGIWAHGTPDMETVQASGDWGLIGSSMEFLRCISDRPGEIVAVRSYRALQQLTQSQSMGPDVIESSAKKFKIPFFEKFLSWSETASIRAASLSISLRSSIAPPAQPCLSWASNPYAAQDEFTEESTVPFQTTVVSNAPQPTFDWSLGEFSSVNNDSLFFQGKIQGTDWDCHWLMGNSR
jgi:hypothetical protein